MMHMTAVPYVIGVLAVGILGNVLVRKVKSKTARRMILVLCMVTMLVLVAKQIDII